MIILALHVIWGLLAANMGLEVMYTVVAIRSLVVVVVGGMSVRAVMIAIHVLAVGVGVGVVLAVHGVVEEVYLMIVVHEMVSGVVVILVTLCSPHQVL